MNPRLLGYSLALAAAVSGGAIVGRFALPDSGVASTRMQFLPIATQERVGLARDTKTIDFGVVARGRSISHSYWLMNRESYPLTIAYSETTCDCLRVVLPTEAILPGGKALVRMCFDSAHDPDFVGSLKIGVRLLDSGKRIVQDLNVNVEVSAISD